MFKNSTDDAGPAVSKEGFGSSSGYGRLYENEITAGLFQNVTEGHSIAAVVPRPAGGSIIDSKYIFTST